MLFVSGYPMGDHPTPILKPIRRGGELNFRFRFGGCPVAHCRAKPPHPDGIHHRARSGSLYSLTHAFQDERTVNATVDPDDETHGKAQVIGRIKNRVRRGQRLGRQIRRANTRLRAACHLAEEGLAYDQAPPWSFSSHFSSNVAPGHARWATVKDGSGGLGLPS
jgi:hypothetical protein